MSFQRRVGHGPDANRGALPIHVLRRDTDVADVLVPLLRGEDVWIALQVLKSADAHGNASDGRGLCTRIRDLPSSRLLVIDGVEGPSGIRPLNSFVPAAAAADISWQLDFVIANVGSACYVRAQFVTAPFYSELSGLPAPTPTSPADGFSGRRLP